MIICLKLGNFSQRTPAKYRRITFIIQLKIRFPLDYFMEVLIYLIASQVCISWPRFQKRALLLCQKNCLSQLPVLIPPFFSTQEMYLMTLKENHSNITECHCECGKWASGFENLYMRNKHSKSRANIFYWNDNLNHNHATYAYVSIQIQIWNFITDHSWEVKRGSDIKWVCTVKLLIYF